MTILLINEVSKSKVYITNMWQIIKSEFQKSSAV